MKPDQEDRWKGGIDLSEALAKFSPPELVERLHGLRRRTKAHLTKRERSMLEVAEKSEDGTLKGLATALIGLEDYRDWSSRRSKMLDQMVAHVTAALRSGDLVAMGFVGKNIDEVPRAIPARFLTAANIDFERNSVRVGSRIFRDVRIVAEEMQTTPAKKGRPNIQSKIRQAMMSLAAEGVNLNFGPQKTHIAKIQQRMKDLFGPSCFAAERTIKRVFTPNLSAIAKEKRNPL